jgi:hypothetical protein
MDEIEEIEDNEELSLLKKRSLKIDLHIYQGQYPHLC